VCKRFHEKKKW